MKPSTIPSPSRLAETPELRDRLIAYIAARDHIDVGRAKAIFAGLPIGALIRLELEAGARTPPSFTAEYDPLRRG